MKTIIYLALAISYPLGIYHSVKDHSKGNIVASILIPPYGMYRGVEMFWHEDKSTPDKQDIIDAKKALMIILTNHAEESKAKANELTTQLKKNMPHYTKIQREDLKSFCSHYTILVSSVFRDTQEFLMLESTETNGGFNYSEKTKSLISNLKGQGVDNDIYEAMKSIKDPITKLSKENSKSYIDDYLKVIEMYRTDVTTKNEQSCNNIFKGY